MHDYLKYNDLHGPRLCTLLPEDLFPFLAGASSSAYLIGASGKFSVAADPRLVFEQTLAGDTKKVIIDFWCQRSELNVASRLLDIHVGSGNFAWIGFYAGGELQIAQYSSTYDYSYVTTQTFTDPNAFMHFRFEIDTDAASGERVKIYHNEERITDFGTETEPTSGLTIDWNAIGRFVVGARWTGSYYETPFGGYISQFIKLDGQMIGETTEADVNGYLMPVNPSGLTFGTNGFWLDFEDHASVTNLCLYSEAADNAWWTKYTATVTANDATGPLGGTVADRIEGTGSDSSFYRNGITVSDGVEYEASLWLKSSTPQTIYCFLDDGTTLTSEPCAVTADWQRFKFNHLQTGTTVRFQIGGGSSLGVGEQIHVFGMQLKAASEPDYYVRTEGTARTVGGVEIDVSGQQNHFTNSEVTSSLNAPTNSAANDAGLYPVLSPILPLNAIMTISHAGTRCTTTTSSGNYAVGASLALPDEGVWEVLATVTEVSLHWGLGVVDSNVPFASWSDPWTNADGNCVIVSDHATGRISVDGSAAQTAIGAISNGDKFIIQADVDNGTVKFFRDTGGGVSQYGWTVTGRSLAGQLICFAGSNGSIADFDFGADDGFALQGGTAKYLCSAHFPVPDVVDPTQHYHSEKFLHDGSSHTVNLPWDTDVYPTYILVKDVDNTEDWFSFNTKSGDNEGHRPNSTSAGSEETTIANSCTFSGSTVVLGSHWSNSNHLIMAFRQDNQFQFIRFTGTGVAHTESFDGALSTAPGFMYSANLETNSLSRNCYHEALGPTKVLQWDNTSAEQLSPALWDDTAPTTTEVSVGTASPINQSGKAIIVAAWADGTEGGGPYRFGSYTGNGAADGPLVGMGGLPDTFFTKVSSTTNSWWVGVRSFESNPFDYNGYVDTTNSFPVNATAYWDFISTGLKCRNSFNVVNQSSQTFVWGAFGVRPITDGAAAQARAV